MYTRAGAQMQEKYIYLETNGAAGFCWGGPGAGGVLQWKTSMECHH